MTFNGWAFSLNGVTLTACESQADWDELDCFPTEVIDALTDTADGLGLPGLRTEDVSYYQRDGVVHFSDWYTERFITLTGTIGPDTTCACDEVQSCGCTTTRQQLQDLVQAWKRSCCDTELVIYTDCYQPDLVDGINLYPDGTFDVDDDGWTADTGVTVARVTTPVHTGAGSLEITWDTDAVAYGKKAQGPALTGLTEGDKIRVSAWLYGQAGGPELALGCATDAAATDITYSDDTVPADDAWHYIELDFYVSDTGEAVPLVAHVDGSTAGELSYVDDVEMMAYTAVDRTLNGPFGVVGRPRVFTYKPKYHGEKIFDFVARFDAVDQRMYVLDECGTPGYESCVDINPGSQKFAICAADGICAEPGGVCLTTPVVSDDSVEPTEILVGGTERVFPTITLYPPLIQPYVENITTGEYVSLDTTMDEDDLPVTINTENGTAFDSAGNSMTHLLRGSLFLSMEPGNYNWRLMSAGVQSEFDDPGYMTICFRSTVVAA